MTVPQKQECIPVGCVPSAAVAVLGEGSAKGGVCPGGCTPSPCEQNHRQVKKHYFSATSFADGIKDTYNSLLMA